MLRLPLDVASSTASFVVGFNAIVVPRSIFLDSKLKSDFDAGAYWPLADATLYGEDLGYADVSEGVAGTIAKALSGSNANNVLDRLLRNVTNALVYEYVDVTSYAVRANLPSDVVRILPWEKVTNGPTGGMPADFWQKIGAAASTLVNSLLYMGQLIYQGLVALVTFLVNLGEAIWDWGMRAAGAVSQYVDAAVDKVGQLLDEFARLIVEGIKALFASIHAQLKALWDATVGAYLAGIQAALTVAVAEFEGLGRIAEATEARLRAAFMAPLFWAFFGVAVAVVAGYVAYAVSTLGLGVLVAGVGITVALALASQVFGLGLEDFGIDVSFDPGQSVSQLIASFLDWGEESNWIEPSMSSLSSAVLGALFGIGSLIGNLLAIAALDHTASTATALGLFFGIISLGLSFGTAVGGAVGKAVSVVGGFLGFVGVFFSVIGMLKSKGFYAVVNLAGNVLGATGAALGVTYAGT